MRGLVRRRATQQDAAVLASNFTPRRLAAPERSRLLREILALAGARHDEGPPVLVFDLDGTLMDNRPRVVRILHELADVWASSRRAEADKLRASTIDGITYGVIANVEALGVVYTSLHEEVFTFWKDRFFRDEYLRHDVALPGAVSFVRACYEAGASIVYLTGRDLPAMALGTFASLRDLGFPIGVVNTSLVLKPDFETPDVDFKRGVAPAFGKIGRVVAAFDNEPANNNLFVEHHPGARSVFVDTQHAPDPPPLHPEVAVIDSFVTEG
jgi:hypothetical protein